MPAVQATKATRIQSTRRRSVARQASGVGVSAMAFSLPRRDDRRGGRFVRDDALEDVGVGGRRLHHLQPGAREQLNPVRPGERLYAQLQVAVDLLFGGAFFLHLLDSVAVADQLEVLPCRVEEDRDE